ncbi:MAG TPA: nicotinate-nicotinamide nucleotide adenylyltransferase [Gaiellaceae bacterium]|nr:nicotinate-nicotinamide nucleotide adenylyltransferase [Gaiellaceae bacterium]
MIGLLGGAFDPPHNGHVALADAAERQLGLDAVVVVVAADPGHKEVHAPAEDRLELARLAFPGREVVLDGHARTVDLLRERRWPDPVFLIGADEYLDFPTWKEPETVLELARLGVATRPGFTLPEPPPERVAFFEIEPLPVSSREIRALVARGKPIDGLVPAAVAAAIAGRGLYHGLDWHRHEPES